VTALSSDARRAGGWAIIPIGSLAGPLMLAYEVRIDGGAFRPGREADEARHTAVGDLPVGPPEHECGALRAATLEERRSS
jgi:hypothetical protein